MRQSKRRKNGKSIFSRTSCLLVLFIVKMFSPIDLLCTARLLYLTFFPRCRHERMFSYIETIVAGDDAAVKDGKPAPDIYLEAAKRLNNGTGVPPSQCLVFEDALSGVRSAKAAGCYVVAIPDTRYSKEEKAVFHDEADMVLSDLSQFQGHRFGLDIDMTKTTTGTSGTSLV